jgi:NAD(P)-dependent dehydrogenase (short-subunit alcohol dehydrogenase family)
MPIYIIELQVDDYNSVMAFCNQVNSIMKHLDIVVLNAGIGGYDFDVSKSGHENIMQVNVYPNILLKLELLSLLKKSSRVRRRLFCLTWVGSSILMDHSFEKSSRSTATDVFIMKQLENSGRFSESRYQGSNS